MPVYVARSSSVFLLAAFSSLSSLAALSASSDGSTFMMRGLFSVPLLSVAAVLWSEGFCCVCCDWVIPLPRHNTAIKTKPVRRHMLSTPSLRHRRFPHSGAGYSELKLVDIEVQILPSQVMECPHGILTLEQISIVRNGALHGESMVGTNRKGHEGLAGRRISDQHI